MARTMHCLVLLLVLAPAGVRAHGDLHEQIVALTARIEAEPTSAVLQHKRGELYRAHGDHALAQQDYARAQQLDPDLHVVHLSRGRSLLECERFDAAVTSLDVFLKHSPEHAQAHLLRARALVGLSRRAEADRDYEQALLGMADASPDVYLERAANLVALGSREKALSTLGEATEKLGPLITLDQAALDIELALGHHDAALARLDTMLARAPRREALLATKATIHEHAGDPAAARLAREQAVAEIDRLPAAKRGLEATKQLRKQLVTALASAP